jgi:hypothetical protein
MTLRPRKVFKLSSADYEGDEDVIRIERYIGRLQGLIKYRKTYAANISAVKDARWRQRF